MCSKWFNFKDRIPPVNRIVWIYIRDSGEIFLTSNAKYYYQSPDSDTLFWRYPDAPEAPVDN